MCISSRYSSTTESGTDHDELLQPTQVKRLGFKVEMFTEVFGILLRIF